MKSLLIALAVSFIMFGATAVAAYEIAIEIHNNGNELVEKYFK